ncbi:MAG: DUF1801 domain-containing protein [Chitinophagales bacterium]
MKIQTLTELYSILPEEERIMVDVLRELVIDAVPDVKEKLSFNVPYFYKKKGMVIIWPAKVPRGGFKEGVLFGFWYGKLLLDKKKYLTHGTNKQIFYKIFRSVDEIHEKALRVLLKEADEIDNKWK